MQEAESVLGLLGLPAEFGYILLVLALILTLAPYFSGQDFGILKIPEFAAGMRRSLKFIGPITLLLAVGAHVQFYSPGPKLPPDAGQLDSPPATPSGPVFISDVRVLGPWQGDNCLYPGTVIESRPGKSLVRFDFGQEKWVETSRIHTVQASPPSNFSMNIDVYVELESGRVWAPGKIKEQRSGKNLVQLSSDAGCRSDNLLHVWATMDQLVFPN